MNVIPTSCWMPLQLELHLLAELEVQRAERLVEQQHLRPVHQRSSQRDALLLPTGHLPGLALLEPPQLDQAQRVVDPGLDLVLGDLLPAQPERDVLEHVQVREQRVGLEHGVDVALVRREVGDVAATQVDRPARRILEPADHPKRGRLPAPRGPEQAEELPLGDVEREIVDRDRVAERLRHPLEADVDLRHATSCRTNGTGRVSRHTLERGLCPTRPTAGHPPHAPRVRRCPGSSTRRGHPRARGSTPDATGRHRGWRELRSHPRLRSAASSARGPSGGGAPPMPSGATTRGAAARAGRSLPRGVRSRISRGRTVATRTADTRMTPTSTRPST